MGSRADTLAAWRSIEQLHQQGQAKKIGVSNFNHQELSWLLGQALAVKPHFVQNRCLHKDDWDGKVRELCAAHGIRYQGFWLLTGNRQFSATGPVREVAAARQLTPAQV